MTLVNHHGKNLFFPRRIRVRVLSGRSPPKITGCSVDAEWRQTATDACQAASRLTNEDRAIEIEVAPGPPLTGKSAGMTIGILAIFAQLGSTQAPSFYATGHVEPERGHLFGGVWLEAKANAVSTWTFKAFTGPVPFLAPPIWPIPETGGQRVITSCDLGSALATLSASAYDQVKEAHRDAARAPHGKGSTVDQWWLRGAKGLVDSEGHPDGGYTPGMPLAQGLEFVTVGQGPYCVWSQAFTGPVKREQLVTMMRSIESADHVARRVGLPAKEPLPLTQEQEN